MSENQPLQESETMEAIIERPLILVCDDQVTIFLVLEEILEDQFKLEYFPNGLALKERLRHGPVPDMVITDIVMPEMDGLALCAAIKGDPATMNIPVLVISSLDSDSDEAAVLALGANDFIQKPFSPPIVLARVRSHLALAAANSQLRTRNDELASLVAKRTAEIIRRGEEIMVVQEATITALCALAEVRDDDTGNHIVRTQHYVHVLAMALKDHPAFVDSLNEESIRMIVKSAPLHDIGKVAIPDSVLLKPGKLNDEEWAIMKQHCEFGRAALAKAIRGLSCAKNAYLTYGMEIAYGHHERWDGKGYPQGLAGAAIPVSARLMALADVYDALTSRRVYKKPMSHEEAIAIICQGRGGHFDPEVVDAFVKEADVFLEISQDFCDLP
jgi:putative two-component system response regulator